MNTPLVLVTGGAGFLGQAVVRRCLARGYRVRILGRTPLTGELASRIEFIRGDIGERATVDAAVKGCAYAETKAIAEEVALKAASEQLKVCALRPHLIWGPGDPHIFPRILARARAGKLRIVGEGQNQVDVTHVDTAADAHLGALDALLAGRANGKAYFLSQGEPVKLWEFINRLLVGAGEKPVTRRISQRAAYWLGALLEGVWTLFRLKGEPPMTRFVAVELAKDHWYDVSAARRDLGLKPAVETWAELDRLAATLRTK